MTESGQVNLKETIIMPQIQVNSQPLDELAKIKVEKQEPQDNPEHNISNPQKPEQNLIQNVATHLDYEKDQSAEEQANNEPQHIGVSEEQISLLQKYNQQQSVAINDKKTQTEQVQTRTKQLSQEKNNSFLYYKQKLNHYQDGRQEKANKMDNPQSFSPISKDALYSKGKIRQLNLDYSQKLLKRKHQQKESKESLLHNDQLRNLKKSRKSMAQQQQKFNQQQAQELLNANIAFVKQLRQKSGSVFVNLHEWRQEPKKIKSPSLEHYNASIRGNKWKKLEALGFSGGKRGLSGVGSLLGNYIQPSSSNIHISSVQLPKINHQRFQKRQWKLQKPPSFNIYNVNLKQHQIFHNPN